MSQGLLPVRLYVFLDEGGDFNFTATGTRYFTLTMVTRTRPFSWDSPLAALKYDLIEQGLNIEYFHAAEDRQAVRDRVFAIVGSDLGAIRAGSLVVEKSTVEATSQSVERFYPKMLGILLRAVLESEALHGCNEVILITDSIPVSRKRQAVEKAVKQTLAAMLPPGNTYRVLRHASKSCMGLQVADYCNWAVFRKWERGDVRSYQLVRAAVRRELEVFHSPAGDGDAPSPDMRPP